MQSFNRTENTKRNIFWGFASKGVAVLGPFVTRTFLIYCLGAEYLGANSLYTSILQVLNLAELGFASAVVYSMYRPVAEGNLHEVAAYLNYFKIVYRLVGTTILAMGFALIPFLGFLVKGSWPTDVNMQIAFLIYLFNTAISYFLYAYKRSLLNAYQRNDVINKVNMAVMCVQYGVQTVLLITFPNFYLFAIVMPACTIMGNILTAYATKKMFPEFSDDELKTASLGHAERKRIRKRVAGLVFQQLCQVTRSSCDNIIISAFIGLVAVACYGNYFVVMSGILGVIQTIGTSMTAAIGNSVAVESKEKNFADLRLFMFLYAFIALVCIACLMSCYQPFIRMWVGADLMLPGEIPVLMALYFYICTMGDMLTCYVNATGIWWELRWRALAEAVANLVLNLVLVQILGLPGVISATILSLFVLNFFYGSYIIFKSYFGVSFVWSYYKDHLIYLIAAIAICALSYLIASQIPDSSILLLMSRIITAFLVSVGSFFILFFWTNRFKVAKTFVVNMFKRKE